MAARLRARPVRCKPADDASVASGVAEAARGAKLRPLLALLPYVARYRGRALCALVALVVAALTTLVVPVAVRRMIDFGFTADGIAMINNYFSVMIAVVAVLAVSSASRFYLVMTIGERIVADIRSQVFEHLTALSPSFFDTARSGELISRLTADTTQIKSAVGASVSIALRNFVLFVGAATMMVVTSPRLSGFVLLMIPLVVLPLVAFGRWVRRLSRDAQDSLAEASAYASELIGASRTVQAFTNERLATTRFSGEVERAYAAARNSTKARAVLTAIIIFIIFTSVVGILWVGSHDVLSGQISAGTLSQFILYAVFAAGALGELSQVWGEVSAASGAAERLFEILRVKPEIAAPAHPRALPLPPRGDVAFENVRFAYPTRPETFAIDGVTLNVRQGEKVAIVGPSGAGKSTLFHLLLRFYDPTSGTIALRRHSRARCRSARGAQAHRAGAAGFGHLRRQRARQHPLRPPGGQRCGDRARGAACACDRVHPSVAEGFDTPLGERGVTLSGGQRQRHRDRPRNPARRTAAPAGRSDLVARCGKRDAGADRARGSHAQPHHAGDRPSPRHRALLRPHRRDGAGQDRRAGHAHRARRGRRPLCAAGEAAVPGRVTPRAEVRRRESRRRPRGRRQEPSTHAAFRP